LDKQRRAYEVVSQIIKIMARSTGNAYGSFTCDDGHSQNSSTFRLSLLIVVRELLELTVAEQKRIR
jgi:hypothetical protein